MKYMNNNNNLSCMINRARNEIYEQQQQLIMYDK